MLHVLNQGRLLNALGRDYYAQMALISVQRSGQCELTSQDPRLRLRVGVTADQNFQKAGQQNSLRAGGHKDSFTSGRRPPRQNNEKSPRNLGHVTGPSISAPGAVQWDRSPRDALASSRSSPPFACRDRGTGSLP